MAIVKIDPILKPLIPKFLDNRQQDILDLKAAISASDYEAMRIIGHNLRGSGKGYGFAPITEMGTTIEEAVQAQDMATIESTVNELASYLDSVEPVYE